MGFVQFLLSQLRAEPAAPTEAALVPAAETVDPWIAEPRFQRYISFLSTQQCLASQSTRCSMLDFSLTLLVLLQIVVLLYISDQVATTKWLYFDVVDALTIAVTAFALGLLFIRVSDRSEPNLPPDVQPQDVDATLDEALSVMAADFARNRQRLSLKTMGLRWALVLTVLCSLATPAASLYVFIVSR